MRRGSDGLGWSELNEGESELESELELESGQK